MLNIYQHIGKNKRDTFVIMVLFIAVISFIGWFVGEYFFEGEGMFFIGFAFIISGLSSVISYYNSDKIVLSISKAEEADKNEYKDLYNLVENMSIASGIPIPRVYIINDTAMNAFATGRDPKHAVICFTSGIISRLDKRELEGVTAHEMSHVGNYDIRLMSIVSILVGMITLIADWFTRGMFYKNNKRDSKNSMNGTVFLIGMFLLVLSPLIATLIKLAVSRSREYLADSTAALITRYPKGLANALRKIAEDKEVLEVASGATAHLYIESPLKNQQSFLTSLFSTHPPVNDRIKRLEAM